MKNDPFSPYGICPKLGSGRTQFGTPCGIGHKLSNKNSCNNAI